MLPRPQAEQLVRQRWRRAWHRRLLYLTVALALLGSATFWAFGVVYLSPADKYHRLTRRLSQEQKGLEERALMASQRPSHPW